MPDARQAARVLNHRLHRPHSQPAQPFHSQGYALSIRRGPRRSEVCAPRAWTRALHSTEIAAGKASKWSIYTILNEAEGRLLIDERQIECQVFACPTDMTRPLAEERESSRGGSYRQFPFFSHNFFTTDRVILCLVQLEAIIIPLRLSVYRQAAQLTRGLTRSGMIFKRLGMPQPIARLKRACLKGAGAVC